MTLMTREEHYDDETSLQECLKYLFSKVKEYNETGDQECLKHREITIIELQSLVVFGCAALLFMAGELSVHMIE